MSRSRIAATGLVAAAAVAVLLLLRGGFAEGLASLALAGGLQKIAGGLQTLAFAARRPD